MGINIQDIAYVGFSAPDLEEMEKAFLTEFGMVCVQRAWDALYVRGLDGDPFLNMTHRGEPRFLAAGFEAASMRDLEALAREEKAMSHPLDRPAGDSVVRLTDPDGSRAELVAGRRSVAPMNARAGHPINDAYATPRLNTLARLSKGPSHAKRLGHRVLNLNNSRESEAWYESRFGLITSDEINQFRIPGASPGCIFVLQPRPEPERLSLSLSAGNRQARIQSRGLRSSRFRRSDVRPRFSHAKRSPPRMGRWAPSARKPISDYWRDPWAYTLEHWTDGDLLDAVCGSCSSKLQDAPRT